MPGCKSWRKKCEHCYGLAEGLVFAYWLVCSWRSPDWSGSFFLPIHQFFTSWGSFPCRIYVYLLKNNKFWYIQHMPENRDFRDFCDFRVYASNYSVEFGQLVPWRWSSNFFCIVFTTYQTTRNLSTGTIFQF